MLIRLSRTVAKRSSAAVAKRLLEKAIIWSTRKCRWVRLRSLSVRLTENGHYAEAEISGNKSTSNFMDNLRETLVSRFDPPWLVVGDGEPAAPAEGEEGTGPAPAPAEPARQIGAINSDIPPETFARIYGREAQIRRIMDAIRVGQETGWTKRRHTLLSGPPGCGKTELLLTLARALGREGESWLWFDATSTSRAGAVEQLIKAPSLPPILFVEEIEKVQEGALRWLLGVMDERGEIRRTNYRVGNEVKSVRLVVIATANNVGLLQGMDSGALYSRFGNRIDCPPPDRLVMEKILAREVSEMPGGSHRWIGKAMEFGFDRLGIRDCREMLNILLCGRDRLMNGEYQEDYLNTMPPQDRKMLRTEKT